MEVAKGVACVLGRNRVTRCAWNMQADVRDAAAVSAVVQRCDVVVHMAAETHVDRSIADAQPFITYVKWPPGVGCYYVLHVIHSQPQDKCWGHTDAAGCMSSAWEGRAVSAGLHRRSVRLPAP